MRINNRQFQAQSRIVVSDRCESMNQAIIEILCKLTYLKSPQTHNHWIRNLVGIFKKGQNSRLKNGSKFDYDWFFQGYGELDEEGANSFIWTIDDKYEDIMPEFMDPNRLMNNLAELRFNIKVAYANKGSLLSESEIRDIIESLDLYK